ncbi:MAG: PriCT-2 domain-containing protein [Prevotella pectinovora]|nr:PriCT-2 domain-containing protein [Prevotella pectinovora]
MSAAFSLYFYPCGLSGLAAVEQLHEACQGYDNWLRLAFALSDGLGEAGRQIFDRLSQMNADYDTRECNRLYDNCMKGNKGGITIATFFQMARDLANVDLKEMARERGKREEESTKSTKSTKVPKYHKNNIKCNKKDNILIYNNLDKSTIHHWNFGTLGLLGLSCKNFSNGYTFSDKLDTEDLPPILNRIMQLHDDVVSRDKMIIGTLNIVSGLIGAASGTPDMPSGVYGLYDGRKVYAPLYNILFANAGSSKGDLNFCRQLAKPLKDEMRREYEGKKMEYERLMAAYEAKRKQKAAEQKRKTAGQRMQTTDWLTTKHLFLYEQQQQTPLQVMLNKN